MTSAKYDINLAAKLLLSLSLLANLMLVINACLIIYTNSMMGLDIVYPLTNLMFTLGILLSGIMIFRISKIALILFISFFVIRLLILSSLGGHSFAFNVGMNLKLVLRDLVPFLVVLCFKKNGVVGWKAFFSKIQNEEVQRENSNSDCRVQSNETAITVIEDENDTKNDEVIINTPESESEIKNVLHGICKKVGVKKVEEANSTHDNHRRVLGKNVLVLLIIITVTIAAFFSYIGLKTYPDYISEFGGSYGDKWKYTFNQANDSLANRIYKKAMDNRYSGAYLMYTTFIGGYHDFRSNNLIYDNNYINYPTVYAITDTICSKDEILTNEQYGIHNNKALQSKPWTITSGEKLYQQYHKIEHKLDYIDIVKLARIPLEEQILEENRLMDFITEIPISDLTLLNALKYHFCSKDNYTKLSDLYIKSLSANKNNPEVNALLASCLYEMGDKESAFEYANKALKLNEKELLALEIISLCHADNKLWKDARQFSRKAIDYGSRSSIPYFVYACSSFELKEIDDAHKYYNMAVNLGSYSKLSTSIEKKYEYCAGPPFRISDINIGFTDSKGNTITEPGHTLYSSKSKYIKPVASINVLRISNCIIDCKLYINGKLSEGQFSENGYTYSTEVEIYDRQKGDLIFDGWGSDDAGNYKPGSYRFEVWYKNQLLFGKDFRIY